MSGPLLPLGASILCHTPLGESLSVLPLYFMLLSKSSVHGPNDEHFVPERAGGLVRSSGFNLDLPVPTTVQGGWHGKA